MDRDPPFDFIFDYLLAIELMVKPFFGMFAIYANSKLLLLLRERNNEPEKNGIWIATVGNSVETLKKDLPGSQVLFERKSRKDEWLFIPADDDAFERSAISLCELIVRRDPRIGRIPKPRARKRK